MDSVIDSRSTVLIVRLTARRRELLQKLSGSQLGKKFPVFYGSQKFITLFTSALHLSLSCARSMKSVPPHPTSWRPILYRLLTFHVPNLISLFHCWDPIKVSAQVRGMSVCYVTIPVFTVRSCQHLVQRPNWKTTSRCLLATAYSIYSQLPSILEAVPPSATRGRTMQWS